MKILAFIPLFFCLLGGDQSPDDTPFFEGTASFSVTLSGPMADQLKVNEPNNKLLIHFRQGDYIVMLSGGRYPKTFMYINKYDMEFSVNTAQKKLYRYYPGKDMTKKQKPLIAKFTGKTAEVKGIECQVYMARNEEVIFYYFVNDAYRMDTSFFDKKKQAKASFLVEGLDGRIPLKTVKKKRGLTVVTSLQSITPREFSPEQFAIPPGFKVDKRDYRY
ncbi:MAG: hypothetical protein AAGI38_05440 [Bacteroidota bacterium]